MLGAEVTAFTDHWALVHLQTQDTLSDRQARWVEILQDFNFTIAYIPGPDNHLADFLSRLPTHAPRCIKCAITLRADNIFSSQDMLEGESDTINEDEHMAEVRAHNEEQRTDTRAPAEPTEDAVATTDATTDEDTEPQELLELWTADIDTSDARHWDRKDRRLPPETSSL